MKIAIAFKNGRVAPVVTDADGVLIVTMQNGRIISQEKVGCHINSVIDLITIAQSYDFVCVVCGGDCLENRGILDSYDICLVDNISCSIDKAIEALQDKTLWAQSKNTWKPEYSRDSSHGIGVPDELQA